MSNRSGRLSEAFRQLESTDWRTVCDSLRAFEFRLRGVDVRDNELRDLAAALVALTTHQKWEVRKALAVTLLYLRHPNFEVAIASLIEDENSFVRDAAKRTLARRSEIATTDVLNNQHDDMMRRWLADLEASHGAGARDAAVGVARKFAGVAMQEAHHELIKILAPADSVLSRLAKGLEAEELDLDSAKNDVKAAQERTRLLAEVVRSLRGFYADVAPRFESEDVKSILDEACSIVADVVATSGRALELSVDVLPSGVRLEADRHRLVQAITNVLKNSAEACAKVERPTVRVSARVHKQTRQLIVACIDNGCGMSSEACDDAFKLYSSSKDTGRGFGLPLAKKIVESEHRGLISIFSKLQEGTTVRIALPLEQHLHHV